MEKNQTPEQNPKINEDEISYTKNLLMDLLKIYSYDDIMNYLLHQEIKNTNKDLENNLKELIEKVDIELLAKLLIIENNNKLIENKKIEDSSFQPSTFETDINNLDIGLKIDNDSNINKKIKLPRKKREKPKPSLSKIVYRKKNNQNFIYIYRFITDKKNNRYLLRCQDKNCKSKASYNFNTKEINIYEDHTKDIQSHIYLSEKSNYNIKDLISYMKENEKISCFELYSDNSKIIISNFNESNNMKNQKENYINKQNSLLNKKRNYSSIFLTRQINQTQNQPLLKFISKKSNIMNKKKYLFKVKNTSFIEKQTIEKNIKCHNDEFNLSEEIETEKNNSEPINIKEEEFLNEKENYCEIKDKFLKHNQLLTKIEQECFGENRRLGTHFHKEENGDIYNYFGNNKEIKNFDMNYRCTLKGCKSKAIYNLKYRTFTIVTNHTRPYEEHSCSEPNSKITKEWINYLKSNNTLTDLQIILI